jgi:hypothetical protein
LIGQHAVACPSFAQDPEPNMRPQNPPLRFFVRRALFSSAWR